jgi:hypothetical protein
MLTLLQLPTVGKSCFSKEQVQELYLRSGAPIDPNMSVEEQLATLDTQKLYTSIMINPVDSGLPPAVLYDLQMSFRPILKHSQPLEESDIAALMARYVYWLKNLSIISMHVLDEFAHDKLKQSKTRFSVGFRQSASLWSCVLIDVESHTFEFYDPGFTDVSQLGDVAELFETAKLLDPEMETRTIQLIRRGFESTPDPHTCALSVLGFIHYRVVENKMFEDIVNSKDLLVCEKLRGVFFQTRETRFVSKCSAEFPETVHQLASIDFGSFLDYLAKIVDNLQTKQDIREFEAALRKQPSEKLAVSIQERLMHILPVDLVEFVGTDVWQRITEEICNDPLTKHLHSLDSKQRLALMLDLYEPSTEAFSHHVLVALNAYRYTDPKPSAVRFLEWAASKKSLSGFGVHFLREMSNWMARKSLGESKIQQEFPVESFLVKPIHSVDEARDMVDKCEHLIAQASQLLTEQIQDVVVRQETLVDLPKIHNILLYNELDLLNHQFLVETLQAWNFPLDETCELLNRLEPRFRVYACSSAEMAACLESELFKMYFSIGVWLAKHKLSRKLLDPEDEEIILQSLRGFYAVATSVSDKNIFCVLLVLMGETRFDCDPDEAKIQSRDFFAQAKQLYASFMNKK